MPSYFREVPNFEYINRNYDAKISDYITVKNLFKRGKIREDIFGNLQFFEKYPIVGDERPDNVAYKVYGDETLDWIVLLSNNILNIQNEWPLPQESFDAIMLEKYGSYQALYSDIHHYETLEVRNSNGIVMLPGGLEQTQNESFEVTNSAKIHNIFCPDNYENDRTVFVGLDKPFYNLKVGDEFIISDVSDSLTSPVYNGKYTVDSFVTINANVISKNALPDSAEIGESYMSLDDNQLWIWDGNIWNNMGTVEYNRNENYPNYIPAFTYKTTRVPETKNPPLNGSEIISTIIPTNYLRFYDYDIGKDVQIPSTDYIIPITNYDYEVKLEDKKRNIYILKPDYLNIVFNDLEDVMNYKEGGTQYVSTTLKRGDNIRLYQ
jgi:hypothetical protein